MNLSTKVVQLPSSKYFLSRNSVGFNVDWANCHDNELIFQFTGRPAAISSVAQLRPLPSKRYQKPNKQYAINTMYSLIRPKHFFETEKIIINLTQTVDIGVLKRSLAVIARVDDGPPSLQGKSVFLNFNPL